MFAPSPRTDPCVSSWNADGGSRRRSLAVCVVLIAASVVGALCVPQSSVAEEPASGYDGPCVGADAKLGTSVVVDFQELDGNGGRPAPQVVRCAPPAQPFRSRTGLQVLKDAGIPLAGVARWGEGFICRLQGRPAADETLPITGNPQYKERCVDTPPGPAYWSYWHADGRGEDWQYSNFGVANRNAAPGGFEGWSFSLNATASTNPMPRYDPVNSAVDPDDPRVSLASTLLKQPLPLGESIAFNWTSDNAVKLTASSNPAVACWSGDLPSSGVRTLRPTEPGRYEFAVTAEGNDTEVTDTYVLEVAGTGTVSAAECDGEPGEPGEPEESGSGSYPAARATAAWLIRELDDGRMPGPTPTPDQPYDWGLTIDTLWALHAAGTGRATAERIVQQVDRNAGDYMGVKLFNDTKVRKAGQTAKLLLAAIVAGKNPRAFGRVMRADGSVASQRYDLREETLALVAKSGPSKGRISDRGVGIDNTNLFSQALAVMGLARSGGVDRTLVDYLLKQQCDAGYFRMFDRNARSCQVDQDRPDGDGTAMGIQALLTAKDNGVTGLDSAIERGLAWMLRVQASDGSFGGGVTTEAANTNSTGLIAQTLAALKKTAAYRKARRWVLGLTVKNSDARGGLSGEAGAIAYNRSSFEAARSAGVAGRDQWRRASAQAIFALAPVPFSELGGTPLSADPVLPPASAAPAMPGAAGPPPASVSGSPVPADGHVGLAAPTPTGQLGAFLARQLVNDDHVRVVVDGTRYVDYDLTADLVFALWSLGEQPGAARRATRFLLDERSIAAYARGKPYEKSTAAYAEPLAKLYLLGRFLQDNGPTTRELDRRIASLGDSLSELRDADGTFTDRGQYGDESASVRRHVWSTLAVAAVGDSSGDRAARQARQVLLEHQCGDGSFPARLVDDCSTPDLTATAEALLALNTHGRPHDEPGKGKVVRPTAFSPILLQTADESAMSGEQEADRKTAVENAALLLRREVNPSGLVLVDNEADLMSTLSSAPARQLAGLDVHITAESLATVQHADGGFAAASNSKDSELETSIAASGALAARSWASRAEAPVAPLWNLPMDRPDPAVSPPADASSSPRLLLALVGIFITLIAGWAGYGFGQRQRALAKERT